MNVTFFNLQLRILNLYQYLTFRKFIGKNSKFYINTLQFRISQRQQWTVFSGQ